MRRNLAPQIIDLFGSIYRNLVKEETDGAELGPEGGTALLSVLRRAGVCTMTDLSRHLRVSKPNTTFLVDRLEERGLVSREPFPGDRRVTRVRLTETGRREIDRRRELALERINSRLSELGKEDRKALEESLSRAIEILATLYAPQQPAGAPEPASKEPRKGGRQ